MADSRVSRDVLDVGFTGSVAALASNQFSSSQLRGNSKFSDALLATDPLTLYDMNGQPLFHDYFMVRSGAAVGTIRTAANRKLGSPVISVSHTPPGWTPDTAFRLAAEVLQAAEPRAIVDQTQLVVYAYPKIGIRLDYRLPGKSAVHSRVFDVSSGNAVGGRDTRNNQFASYSLLDSIPSAHRAKRLKRFAASEKQIKRLHSVHPDLFSPAFSVVKSPMAPIHVNLFPFPVSSGLVRWSPYCPNSPVGLTHYAQITDYFCVDASAQMVMEHYGWNYTQNEIAIAMATTAAAGGTTQAGLTSGWANLTHNSLPLTFDNGASRDQQFADAVTEISANRPLFTQVPHHYRVCVGYFEELLNFVFFSIGLDQMLYIYDPWPWNTDECSGGAIYWESWATSPVEWFGIVHHA